MADPWRSSSPSSVAPRPGHAQAYLLEPDFAREANKKTPGAPGNHVYSPPAPRLGPALPKKTIPRRVFRAAARCQDRRGRREYQLGQVREELQAKTRVHQRVI